MAWGQPRFTADVDVLLRLERAQVRELAQRLSDEGLRGSVSDFSSAFDDRGHVTVFDAESAFHLDVKLASNPLEAAQVESAVEVTLPPPPANARVLVVRPEETIAFKLKFGSPQDLADARSILVRQRGSLDKARLERLVVQLAVEPEWKRLVREAGEP